MRPLCLRREALSLPATYLQYVWRALGIECYLQDYIKLCSRLLPVAPSVLAACNSPFRYPRGRPRLPLAAGSPLRCSSACEYTRLLKALQRQRLAASAGSQSTLAACTSSFPAGGISAVRCSASSVHLIQSKPHQPTPTNGWVPLQYRTPPSGQSRRHDWEGKRLGSVPSLSAHWNP